MEEGPAPAAVPAAASYGTYDDNTKNNEASSSSSSRFAFRPSDDELQAMRRQLKHRKSAAGLMAGGGRLSTRSMNFGIPTNQGAHDHVEERHGKESWRYRALHFLHSSKVQKLLMALLLLDVLILFAELMILANFPHCSIIERDGISCCPATDAAAAAAAAGEDHAERRWLATTEDDGDHHEQHDYCELGDALPDYPAACDEHKHSTVHTTEDWLFALTITILCIFFVELNVAMLALGPAIFFRQFFFALDYVIITVSLVLELTFHALGDDIYQSASGLLVLVRIWRFVRIGHGIVEVTNEMAHEEYTGLLAYTEALELLLQRNEIPLPVGAWKHGSNGHGSGGGDDNLLNAIALEHREKLREKYASSSGDGDAAANHAEAEPRHKVVGTILEGEEEQED